MRLDSKKLDLLKQKAYAARLATAFWRDVAEAMGRARIYGQTLERRVREGRNFRDVTVYEIGRGLGEVFGREVTLADFVRRSDLPRANGAVRTSHNRKEDEKARRVR